MKKFWLVFLLYAVSVNAQVAEVEQFSAMQEKNQVGIRYSVKATFSCIDIKIEHATDTNNFTVIDNNIGACGQTAITSSKVFYHTTPSSAKTNYYRLSFGNFGSSQIIAVKFVPIDISGYQVRLDPGKTVSVIFSNEQNAEVLFKLYNAGGKIENSDAIKVFDRQVDIDASTISPGIKYFELKIGDSYIRGKIIVL